MLSPSSESSAAVPVPTASVDLSSSNVLEGCEVVDATGGRGWGVGLGDAGLGAEPTEPALLGCPCGTLPPAAQISRPAAPSDLW